jgi:uncharacterized Tic20 family protein
MENINIGTDGKVILPQPDEISEKARDDAMGAYLMMFAPWGIGLPLPFLGLIASIIYYFINKKESRFAAFHSYQSLLAHAFVSILNASLVIWAVVALVSEKIRADMFFFTFLIFTIIWNLIYMIFSVIACVRARKGRFYYFLVAGRMAFAKFYGPNAKARENKEKARENRPPGDF